MTCGPDVVSYFSAFTPPTILNAHAHAENARDMIVVDHDQASFRDWSWDSNINFSKMIDYRPLCC